MKKGWNSVRNGDCTDENSANSTTNDFLRFCCTKHKKHDRREHVLFKEQFCCTEMIFLCSRTDFCFDSQSNKFKFDSKGLNRRTLEDSDDGTMSKYCQISEQVFNLTSTNRGFRTMQHAVATYEQTRKEFAYFYPKRNVQQDGKHTRLLNI